MRGATCNVASGIGSRFSPTESAFSSLDFYPCVACVAVDQSDCQLRTRVRVQSSFFCRLLCGKGVVWVLTGMDADEKLIEAVRGYSCLWQVNSKAYKDTIAKGNAWKEVANQVCRVYEKI